MLGIIIGMLASVALALVGAVIAVRFKSFIEESVEGIDNGKLRIPPREKAEIFAPSSVEDDAVEDIIKENRKRGMDTVL